jgi:hypothetical protein
MCEQLGKEPVEAEIPVGWEELPLEAQIAITIYNKLGDRIAAEIGYLGKDYTSLSVLLDIHDITGNRELVLDIIHWLEQKQIKKSADHMKKERDKIRRKTSGPKRSHP